MYPIRRLNDISNLFTKLRSVRDEIRHLETCFMDRETDDGQTLHPLDLAGIAYQIGKSYTKLFKIIEGEKLPVDILSHLDSEYIFAKYFIEEEETLS